MREKLSHVAAFLLVWLAALTIASMIVGCALTPTERCAQVQSARLLAESLPKSPERDQRIAVYAALERQYCVAVTQ